MSDTAFWALMVLTGALNALASPNIVLFVASVAFLGFSLLGLTGVIQ